MKDALYKCEFCYHTFSNESKFLAHQCKQMKRDEEFRSSVGQSAWAMYKKWMELQRKFVPNPDSFLHSKYFSSLVKFARFVRQVKIPDVERYISLMVTEDIPPALWTNDEFYSLYLQYLDKRLPPNKQAEITINTLLNIADAADCDVSEVFDVIEPNELIQLLRQRRLFPWLLLKSPKFGRYVTTRTTTEQLVAIETLIKPDFWKKKITENPDSGEMMKKYVDALGL